MPSRRRISIRARFGKDDDAVERAPEEVDQRLRLERIAFGLVEAAQRQQMGGRHLHPDAQAVRVGGAPSVLDNAARFLERASDLIWLQRADSRCAYLDVDGEPVVAQRLARHECTGLADGLERARRLAAFEADRRLFDQRLHEEPRVIAPVRSGVRAQGADQGAPRCIALGPPLAVRGLEVDGVAVHGEQRAHAVVRNVWQQSACLTNGVVGGSKRAELVLEVGARAERAQRLRSIGVAREPAGHGAGSIEAATGAQGLDGDEARILMTPLGGSGAAGSQPLLERVDKRLARVVKIAVELTAR